MAAYPIAHQVGILNLNRHLNFTLTCALTLPLKPTMSAALCGIPHHINSCILPVLSICIVIILMLYPETGSTPHPIQRFPRSYGHPSDDRPQFKALLLTQSTALFNQTTNELIVHHAGNRNVVISNNTHPASSRWVTSRCLHV
jgi:hypothetical protein